MAPMPKKTREHFTHPGHRLVELYAETEYLCDGCKTLGQGSRYRCNACDFDLHNYCGNCPTSLSSFMHPHPLSLVVRKAQATRQNERSCDVCRDPVEGLFYRCKDCNFDVHPLCTQLPQHLRHVLHQAHPLMLQPAASSSWCAVCGGASCASWRYRCGACGFDIHLDCVLAPCDPPKQRSAPPPPPPWASTPPPPPPPYGAYAHAHAHGVPSSGYSHYYDTYNYGNQAQGNGGGGAATSGRTGGGKVMYALVGKLAVGVLSNVIFGTSNIDFTSFL